MTRTERNGGYTRGTPAATVTVELHLTDLYSAEAVEAGEFSGSLVGGVRVVVERTDSWPVERRGDIVHEAIKHLLSDLKSGLHE